MSVFGFKGIFIKPIPNGVDIDCEMEKNCRNKGRWNIQNGERTSCDKHLLKYIRDHEGNYLIVNKSLNSLNKL